MSRSTLVVKLGSTLPHLAAQRQDFEDWVIRGILIDPLLEGFGPALKVQLSHTQSVLRLPRGARLLAYSDRDPHLAFRVGERAWGLQFHPEFDADIVRAYIRQVASDLVTRGQDPGTLTAACADAPWGERILRRFAALRHQGLA